MCMSEGRAKMNVLNQLHDFCAVNDHVSVKNKDRVTGSFRDYTIASVFQPIFSLSHKNPVGYEALCHAKSAAGFPVSSLALFGQAQSESDSVLLDRLCRAVHVQNFSFLSSDSWIFLNVNPLVTVVGKNYGAFFEEMLAHNGVPPSQVVVEILEKNIYDESILRAAVNYYKKLGCLVAIDDFGASHSNFDRIWNIQPDIVKFDRSIILQAEANHLIRKALPNLVSLIQEIGCITLMEGVETEQQALITVDSNVDMVQGYYFGYPKDTLVNPLEQENSLSRLSLKHAAFSEIERVRYRNVINQCAVHFRLALEKIKAGLGAQQVSRSLLTLPNARRIYFVDEKGYQIGKNITVDQSQDHADPRYKPLSQAVDPNWSRRYYFRQAMLNPGEVQVSRPYRSIVGQHHCITLSALVETVNGRLIVCLDLDWS